MTDITITFTDDQLSDLLASLNTAAIRFRNLGRAARRPDMKAVRTTQSDRASDLWLHVYNAINPEGGE